MDPYSNYQNMNNIDQQIYLQNQYCYPVHFQPNLQSYNYNAPTVYPFMRIPNNQLTLQNVSLNNYVEGGISSTSFTSVHIKSPVRVNPSPCSWASISSPVDAE